MIRNALPSFFIFITAFSEFPDWTHKFYRRARRAITVTFDRRRPAPAPNRIRPRTGGVCMLTKQFRLGQFRFIVLVLVALVVYAAPARAKSKDDVVVLKNGDRMTGEIKKLQRGELIFKASYMADAVRLDWSKVARLESKDKYLIILTDGRLFTDNLRLSPPGAAAADNFLIGAEQNAFKTEQMEVLRITPVEAGFFRQLEGTMDFGLSFTSGNDQYQTDFSSSVTYRKGIHPLTGRLDSTFSGQTEGSSSARNQFTLDYRRQLSPRWYAGGIFDLLRSDQQ